MLNIACSNIRFDNPEDGKHDWNGRRRVLAQAINEFNPSLLGTQEGRKPQLTDLETLLPNLSLIDSHREWIIERMYPCFFYNKNTFKLVNSGDIWLSRTPYIAGSKSFGSAFPRLCTWAILKNIKSKQDVLYVNVHLDHTKTEIRQEQIKVLISEILKINESLLPVVLLGDFNESPMGKVREIINNSSLNIYDPWHLYNKEEIPSHHGFEEIKNHAKRIDWILASKQLKSESIELYLKDEDGIYPSDHFPVFAKLSSYY